MKHISRILPIIIFIFMMSSCIPENGKFTTGIIAILITGAFAVVVLFYFLLRPQGKRKGDKDSKPRRPL